MAVELVAQRRNQLGKPGRADRREGRMPANVYGGPLTESVAITLDQKSAERLIREHGKKGDYTLSLDGQSYPVKVQEVQLQAVKKQILHVDFMVTNG